MGCIDALEGKGRKHGSVGMFAAEGAVDKGVVKTGHGELVEGHTTDVSGDKCQRVRRFSTQPIDQRRHAGQHVDGRSADSVEHMLLYMSAVLLPSTVGVIR